MSVGWSNDSNIQGGLVYLGPWPSRLHGDVTYSTKDERRLYRSHLHYRPINPSLSVIYPFIQQKSIFR